jgi:hypothetical protein
VVMNSNTRTTGQKGERYRQYNYYYSDNKEFETNLQRETTKLRRKEVSADNKTMW